MNDITSNMYAEAFNVTSANKGLDDRDFSPQEYDPILKNKIDFSQITPTVFPGENGTITEVRLIKDGNNEYMQLTSLTNGEVDFYQNISISKDKESGKTSVISLEYGRNYLKDVNSDFIECVHRELNSDGLTTMQERRTSEGYKGVEEPTSIVGSDMWRSLSELYPDRKKGEKSHIPVVPNHSIETNNTPAHQKTPQILPERNEGR